MGFIDRFKKKAANAPDADNAPDDDAAPSGPSAPIQGGLKGHGASAATVLKKNSILTAAVLGALVVGGMAYLVIDVSHGGSSAATSSKIHPVTTVNQMRVPQVKVPSHIVAPVAPTASTVSSAPAAAPAPAPAPAAAPAPAKPSAEVLAQQKLLDSMVASSGSSNVSWKSANKAPTAPAATTAATGAATLPKPANSVYSTHLVRKEVSPYELLQGTVIPATLQTGIKSDLPGTVTAVVNQPVYNSLSGAYVLVPAGSKLIGLYQSKLIAGATRVGVIWDRIEFPNGTYMQIGKSEGYSAQGYAGFHDEVNDHTWTIFKNALLLSLIDVGMSVASPTSGTSTTGAITGNTALQDGEQSLAQTFGQAESQMFQKDVNIAPTLTIRSGYTFNVIVSKDLVFPGPYQHGNQIENQAPTSAAMPTEANPYG